MNGDKEVGHLPSEKSGIFAKSVDFLFEQLSKIYAIHDSHLVREITGAMPKARSSLAD